MAQNDRTTGLVGYTGMKVPVRAASTAAVVLSGEQTHDGVALVTGDRFLAKDQASGVDNGIYVVDTGTWTRAKDFNGTYDVRRGSLIKVNEGTINAGGLFEVATADPITIGTTSLSFSRLTINYVIADYQVAVADQTVFNVPTYQVGANGIAVYVNGLRMRVDVDYSETSSGRITFLYGLRAGDQVHSYAGQAIGNLTAALASLVAVADAGDYFIGGTVEAALQELADAITADNGDASVVLTWGANTPIQRWNTALTANRTVTLSANNAKEGAHFVILRAAGATGNFTLDAGGLCTLRAPGEWCEVRYDAGTAAWVLEKYGTLPSAEVRAMSADNGDASANLTVGTSERTQRWATALTAERTADLQATRAHSGARFRIERLETATGNFSLSVKTGTAVLARLAPGQWCEVEHTGSAWILVAFGNLRQRNTNVVELLDDFLGEEIDGYRWQSLIGTDSACRQGTVLQDQVGGVARLSTGQDAGASMALNGVQLQSQLNWRADKGGLVFEATLNMSAITFMCVFVGLTDQRAALEMPFTLAAGDALTSNATDAVGVLFDTAAATDNWWLVGVKADVDAVKQNSAVAPAPATFETWRIEIDTSGEARFYRNGTLVGVAMANAVTPSAQLTPVVAAFSRTNASRNVHVDLLDVQQQR